MNPCLLLLRRFICLFLGHSSILVEVEYYYDSYGNSLTLHNRTYICERCGAES